MTNTQKLIGQLGATLAAFLLLWYGFSRVPAFQPNNFEQISIKTEEKLSEMILESIEKSNPKITSSDVVPFLDSLKKEICSSNNLVADSIKLHLIKNPDVNAFAFPGNNVVLFTGLIAYSKTAEELSGVIAHEIAHIEKNHVQEKLIKEIGLSMLLVLASGDAGPEILAETVHSLSSSAFDRGQEADADATAVEYLANAKMDPKHFSNFLFRLSRDNRMPEELVWLSTHPDSKERAADILKKRKTLSYDTVPPLKTSWTSVKRIIEKEAEEN
jgi:predicted Zn-dependent protease